MKTATQARIPLLMRWRMHLSVLGHPAAPTWICLPCSVYCLGLVVPSSFCPMDCTFSAVLLCPAAHVITDQLQALLFVSTLATTMYVTLWLDAFWSLTHAQPWIKKIFQIFSINKKRMKKDNALAPYHHRPDWFAHEILFILKTFGTHPLTLWMSMLISVKRVAQALD